MAIELCASCKSRVEEGAVRCASCNASLSLPGTFTQVIGWVVASLSLVPFGISEVTTGERNLIPLGLGVLVLAFGLVLVISGRAKNKSAAPTVIVDTSAAAS